MFGEILCQNVQHPDHLREDEHSVSSLPQPGQQFVQQHQLPAALHQTLEHRSDVQHKEPREKTEKSKAPTPGWRLFVFIRATSQLYFHPLGWSWELHWEVYLEVVLLRFSLALLGVLNEETVVAALFQLHNDVQEARGAAPGAFGESFVIPGQNPPGDIEEKMSGTEEKDRATAKETDVRESPLTCRTASAARTCRRGGSAPPWQAETFPRLS